MREWSIITSKNNPIPPFPSIPYVFNFYGNFWIDARNSSMRRAANRRLTEGGGISMVCSLKTHYTINYGDEYQDIPLLKFGNMRFFANILMKWFYIDDVIQISKYHDDLHIIMSQNSRGQSDILFLFVSCLHSTYVWWIFEIHFWLQSRLRQSQCCWLSHQICEFCLHSQQMNLPYVGHKVTDFCFFHHFSWIDGYCNYIRMFSSVTILARQISAFIGEHLRLV